MYQSQTGKKERNPREKASIISILFFFFTYPIFKKGIKKDLNEDDIYEILSGYRSSKLGDKLEKQWEKQAKSVKPNLVKCLLGVFGKAYMTCGLVQCIVRTTFMVTRPLAMGKLVAYFDKNSKMSIHDAYYYAGLVIAITILQTIYNHGYMLYLQQIAQKIRIGLCSLIYRKSLKLSTSALVDVTSGKIVTLITKDVLLFDSSVVLAHDIWIGVIQVFLMTYVMYKQIGVSAIFGVGFLLLLIPVQAFIGKQTTKARLQTASKSDERIRLIQEVLSTIPIIKTYGWERYFGKLVDYLRKSEIAKLKIIFYLKATMLSIGALSTRFSFFVCLISFTLLGNRITAEKAFVVLGCYGSLRSVLTVAIPLGISQVADLYSSIKRITGYLMIKEVKLPNESMSGPPQITLKGASAEVIKDKTVLHDINLNLHAGLYGLTGPVGSGKSSLLKLMLDDINVKDGYIDINGSISYASQEPWLFPGTIRQNILFGLKMDTERYQTIIKICCLKKDLDKFSKGDNTLVNDRGLNLSKGQQARINLARAIYKNSDIYLLDNPLAAVDITVAKQVFKNCIKDHLKGKLVVLATHQVMFLQEVAEIVVMNNGIICDRGSFKELTEKNVDFGFEITDREVYDVEEDTKEDVELEEEPLETDYLIKSTTSLAKSSKLYSEHREQGKVKNEMYKIYLRYAGNYKWIILLLSMYVVAQFGASYFDYFITYWINIEKNYNRLSDLVNNVSFSGNETVLMEFDDVSQTKSNIPWIYTLVLLSTSAVVLIKSFLFFGLSSTASTKLHDVCFSNIISAPMSFFDTNLSGNILNRFSKDFSTVDEFIPYIIYECLRILFILLGTLILILKVNIFFLFLSAGFGLVLFAVRHYYLPTSRSLKRLDGITRSPVIGHLNASLEGLPTIRASGAQSVLTTQFDRHQDVHSSTSYMYLTTNRAFGFVLDMLCSLYTTMIMLSFILFAQSTAAENVGLAITQAFGLTGLLQWGIRQWAELENQMTSVERIVEYTNVPPEDLKGFQPKSWPAEGKIVYRNVKLRYPKTNELVLKDVSFMIHPKQKIGIVGRTGAGKSSIISVLLRLYQIESGYVFIDDTDINSIALNLIRSNISVIPQNPVLFSGTLRSNLDPDILFSDADLWLALDIVNMKTTITSLQGQLDCTINENGSNFSVGEKQLICLARAVLRKNKILILDEATANVDLKTASFIQETLRIQFSDCTTLIISHRLNSVLNTDKVMVIDDGDVVEFDNPQVLMEDKDSRFYQLVSQGTWDIPN